MQTADKVFSAKTHGIFQVLRVGDFTLWFCSAATEGPAL